VGTKNPLILVVDDTQQELDLTKRAVERRFGADYEIAAELSCRAALELLRTRPNTTAAPVAMVLADLSMPEMDGMALLAEVVSTAPGAKRLLAVTWGELDAAREPILRAVARGDVDGIVAKPWRDAHESFYREVTAYLEQWDHVHRPQFEAVRIVGDRWDPHAQSMRDALLRSGVPFGSYEPDSEQGRALLAEAGTNGPLPIALLYNGRVLIQPSTSDVAAGLGVNADPVGTRYDVSIIGSGPSGLAAAVYAASEGMSVLVVEQEALGGQASSSAMIRNYLGFPRGLSGAELTTRGYRQAWFFGARFLIGRNAVSLSANAGDRIVTLDDGTEVHSRAVVLATGVYYRRLPVEGVDRLVGRGVFYGAPMTEAPGMAGEHVVVVGGGNSSAQMALFMLDYARAITLVTRNSTLAETMSDYLIRDIELHAKIDVRTETVVSGVEGTDRLTAVRLRNTYAGDEELLPAAGLLIMIGAEPQTNWLPAAIERDERGYILTGLAGRRSLETTMAGVFAVGDVRFSSLKRIAAAVGEGSTVVRMCYEYFAERPEA
jgi:thioredoxin reductase (NADPH)